MKRSSVVPGAGRVCEPIGAIEAAARQEPLALRVLLSSTLGPSRTAGRMELLRDGFATDRRIDATVAVARSYEAQAKLLRDGDADVSWLSPTLIESCATDLAAVFRCVRHGSMQGVAALISRGERSFDGHTRLRAGWVSKQSAGGYLLIRHALERNGTVPRKAFKSEVFLDNYPAVCSALLLGKVDVISLYLPVATDDAARDRMRSLVGQAPDDLHIVLSAPMMNDGIAVHRSAPQGTVELLRDLLTRPTSTPLRRAVQMALECDGFAETPLT